MPFAKHIANRVLVPGGTNFAGPYIISQGIAKGSDITLFNRRITNPHLFLSLRRIKGDRLNTEDAKKMAEEHWNVVIDTWSKTLMQ